MKFIFGSVVGRKFQKVSHKIAKVRCTKKEEHIVLENMHEPIIDVETWNKAQNKLNGYTKVRDRKYDHPLKGFVYCGECGNKATLRCREEKRKNGTVWRATYFICSKRNNYRGLCDCKQISANLIEETVDEKLKEENKDIFFVDLKIKDVISEIDENMINEISSKLNEGIDVVVHCSDIKDEINCEEAKNELIDAGIAKCDFPSIITNFLAELTYEINLKSKFILITIGGETSFKCAKKIDCTYLEILDAIMPAIPLCIDIHGKIIITKSGNFGTNSTLIDILNYFNNLK